MPPTKADSSAMTILVVESDILVRHALAEYLRTCGFCVVETAGALEAKTVMQRGPEINVMLADTYLAHGEGGFALAQWTRRYRPQVTVVLTSTLDNKSEAIASLCGKHHPKPPPASFLRDRIQAMRARPARSAVGNSTKRAKG